MTDLERSAHDGSADPFHISQWHPPFYDAGSSSLATALRTMGKYNAPSCIPQVRSKLTDSPSRLAADGLDAFGTRAGL
eukprot:2712982-Pyramimonas_sp.AAC.1